VLNRIKVWVYVLVVVAVGIWTIRDRSAAGSARAVAVVDARLTAAAGQLDVGLKLIESRAASVAGLAALDRALIDALSARPASAPEPKAAKGKAKAKKGAAADPEAEQREEEALERAVESAARDAVERAEKALGFELPPLSFWAAADKGGIAKKLAAGSEGSQKEAVAFLASASKGQPRRGFARVNDGLWYGVGIPMAGGGALVLFVALDEAWARSLQASTGVDVTLSVGLPKAVTTLPPADAKAIATAALARSGGPVDAGKLTNVAAGFELPFKVAPLPLLFGAAPAARAMAVGLTGVKDGYAVLSAPLAPNLGQVVQGQWKGLALLAGVLLLGLFVGLLVHGEAAPQVPDELLQAAARIERGDFGARVPNMAGKYGTVAGALNRAADAASHVAAAVESPDGTAQFFGRAPTHPEAPSSPLGATAPAPAPSPIVPAAEEAPRAFSTTSRLDGSTFAATFGAPVPEPAPAPEQLSEAQEEERHWEETFDEFLRVRDECGEGSDGLTFDRFRLKLEKNKDTLVQKYGCRTVRFQVYVKDGKAALKATPVK
jgi:hypothetical protein